MYIDIYSFETHYFMKSFNFRRPFAKHPHYSTARLSVYSQTVFHLNAILECSRFLR